MYEIPKYGISSVSRLIKQLLLEGKNSVQVYLIVKDYFPSYDDKKLRNLITVVKSRLLKKKKIV